MIAQQFTTRRIERAPAHVVTIDGHPVDAFAVDTQHSTERPKGTATARMPMPSDIDDGQLHEHWLNKELEIQLGEQTADSAYRVFSGRITRIERKFDSGGKSLVVKGTGWASLLDFPSEEDIVFAASTKLYDVVRALCRMRGVPMYGGDLIKYPNSNVDVRLGGVEYVDDGKVIIPKRTSPLSWIVNTVGLFGYYAFDRPDGQFRWARVMGKPAKVAAASFGQGVNVFEMGRDDDLAQMVTWWDVEGASWTDDDGVPVKIRSFPLSVPYSPYLDPPGYVRKPLTSNVLVTHPLADAARNVAEINTSAPYEAETWRTVATPNVQPGEVAQLDSDVLQLDAGKRWILSVDHSSSMSGTRTRWSGWQGAGTALEPGDDSETIRVFTNPQHVGDEYLWHYAVPSPQGREISFQVQVPETFTALVLEMWIHGSNSYLIEGTSEESEVSKVEVWQGDDDKPAGSATLPSMPEELLQRRPYNHPSPAVWKKWWKKARLPIPGRFDAGTITVKLVSGEDRRIGDPFRWDDFEVRELDLVLSGIGYPALPTEGS